jgi:hypothetical protein
MLDGIKPTIIKMQPPVLQVIKPAIQGPSIGDTPMKTDIVAEQFDTEIRDLTKRIQIATGERQAQNGKTVLTKLNDHVNQLQHDLKAAAYLAFKESETYILGLKHNIEAAGVTATDSFTGIQHAVKWLNESTIVTFGNLHEGGVLSIGAHPYLVTSFNKTFADSTATVIRLSSKMHISGQPKTPFNQVDCHFDFGTKTLTLPKRDQLTPDSIVEISGTSYSPKSIFTHSGPFAKYELELLP